MTKRAATDETDVDTGGFYSDRLARRIGLRIFSFALALVVASGVIAYLHATDRETDRTRESVALFVSGSEAALGAAIWNYDSRIVEWTAQTALLIPGVAGVSIEEFVAADKAHATVRLGRFPENNPTPSPTVVSRNLAQGESGTPIGRISLALDEAYIARNVRNDLAATVSVVLLIAFALSMAAFLMIYVDVTCPLHSIVGTVSRFAPDAAAKRRDRIPVFDPRTTNRPDSIGIVANALRNMMWRLDQSFGETQRQSDRLARQRETTLRLSRSDAIRSGDLAAFARQIVAEVQALLGADRVGVWIADADRADVMVAVSQYDRRVPGLTAGEALDLAAVPAYAQALSRGAELPIQDARAAAVLAELRESYLDRTGVGALLDVPVLVDGRLLGLICIEMVDSTRAWEDDECLFAWQLGALVALTYEAQRRLESATALEAANRTLELRIAARTEALARAEAIVRTAIDNMSAAVSIYTADRRLFEWNETFLAFYPNIRAHVEFEAPVDRIYDAMIECGYLPRERAGADSLEIGTHLETTRFGRRLQTTISAIPDGGFVVVSVDLTDIQSARDEAELAASIMREAIEALGASYTVWSAEGELRQFSHNVLSLYEDKIGRIVPGMAFADFTAMIASGGFREDPRFSTVRDGRVFSALDDVAAALGSWERAMPNGRFLRTTGTALSDGNFALVTIDLTELDRTRRASAHAEATLREIVTQMKASFGTYTRDETLMIYGDMYGHDNQDEKSAMAGAVAGISYESVLQRRLADGFEEIRERSTVRNGKTYLEYTPLPERLGVWERFLTDGRYLRTTVSKLKDGNFAVFTQDLTELKEANDALAKSDRMASLGSLVAGVAHEVNTPIGIAMTASTMLVEELSDIGKLYRTKALSPTKFEHFLERSAEIGDMIVRNVGRAGELIANFKQVSIDQTSDSRRAFDLKAYVADVVQSLTPAIARSTHKVEVQGADGVVMNAFPGAIAQIVTNLVMNAMLHAFSGGRSGGRVTFDIAYDAGADAATLLYEDDGVGMDDATLKRVFDPFFTTRRGAGGTGLGMTIVFNLVTQRLGGQIDLASRPGAGVRITMSLPAHAPGSHAEPTAIPTAS